MNTCKDCGESKPWDEFPKNHTYSSGHSNQCKSCRSAWHKAYYTKNADIYKDRGAKRYKADPETAKRRAQARYSEKRDEILAASAEHYQRHRERYREINRAWTQANQERTRAIKRLYKARRQGWAAESMTPEDRTVSAEYRKAITNDACAYCGFLGEGMHDDHVTPLSRGGTDHWWNLVRACAYCNISKGNRTAEEFAAYRERTLAP